MNPLTAPSVLTTIASKKLEEEVAKELATQTVEVSVAAILERSKAKTDENSR